MHFCELQFSCFSSKQKHLDNLQDIILEKYYLKKILFEKWHFNGPAVFHFLILTPVLSAFSECPSHMKMGGGVASLSYGPGPGGLNDWDESSGHPPSYHPTILPSHARPSRRMDGGMCVRSLLEGSMRGPGDDWSEMSPTSRAMTALFIHLMGYDRWLHRSGPATKPPRPAHAAG
jgi:hypothetical protein